MLLRSLDREGSEGGGSAGGELITLIEHQGSLQGEVHDEVRGRMGSVAVEKVGDRHSTGEVVVALLFTAPVRIVDDLEILHGLDIGTSPRFMKWDFAVSG
jgi:hypothetical protein